MKILVTGGAGFIGGNFVHFGRLHGSVLFTNSLNTSFVIKCV